MDKKYVCSLCNNVINVIDDNNSGVLSSSLVVSNIMFNV